MPSNCVLRIPRSDNGGEFVLVNVVSNGPAVLDLKLVATEGINPFTTIIKQNNVSKLQSKNNSLPTAEWEIILRSVLLQETIEDSEISEFLEVVASVHESRLLIVLRKDIAGIHQRLGEISLVQDNDQEIDTIAWVATAVARADSLERDVSDLQRKFQDQCETVKQLNNQLNELIKAKREHEEALLEKFRELLNTKKLKIRDQQRLLATARVDSKIANQVRAARTSSTPDTAAASHPNKRKASAESVGPPSDSDESGFGKMEIDEDRATPEKSDHDATEEDDDDLDNEEPVPPVKKGIGRKGKLMDSGNADINMDEPPPRRELPFGKTGGGRPADHSSMAVEKGKELEAPTKLVSNNDSDTSDDEL